MRTTVTLDPDTERLIRRRMAEKGVSFKVALNEAIRSGLAAPARQTKFKTRVFSMGEPTIDLDRVRQLADALEDEEIARKLQIGK